jgi:hypothetical protein
VKTCLILIAKRLRIILYYTNRRYVLLIRQKIPKPSPLFMWLLGVVCCFVAGMCEVRRGGSPTLSVNYSGEGIEGGDVRGGGGRIFF